MKKMEPVPDDRGGLLSVDTMIIDASRYDMNSFFYVVRYIIYANRVMIR